MRAQALAMVRRPMFREGAIQALPMAIGVTAWGLVAGVAFYAWRRSLFGTIVCGTETMLALRFTLGW